MFEELKQRLQQGFGLVAQGHAIIDDVRRNIAEAKAGIAEDDLAELNRMLDAETEETRALSERIQRA